MSTIIHIKRKDIFKTKGRLSEPPLFNIERLPAHQITRLNSKLAELMASPLYRSYLGELVVPDAAVGDMSAVSAAIMGAQLNLIGGVYVRFNLSPAYTGTVTVGDNSYVVVNGMVGELGYIELNLPADVLFNTVFTVSATDIDGTGIYSLSDYALAVANSNDCSAADKNLVASFYSYAAYAAAYSAIYN